MRPTTGASSERANQSVLASPKKGPRKKPPTSAEIANYSGKKTQQKTFMLTDEWIEDMFNKLDLNGDGVLQWEELQQALENIFMKNESK